MDNQQQLVHVGQNDAELRKLSSVCFHVAVPEVFGWLDDVTDSLLEYLRLREASVSLTVPNLRVSNSHPEHTTARPLGWYESNTAEQPALLLFGTAKGAQKPVTRNKQPRQSARSLLRMHAVQLVAVLGLQRANGQWKQPRTLAPSTPP